MEKEQGDVEEDQNNISPNAFATIQAEGLKSAALIVH